MRSAELIDALEATGARPVVVASHPRSGTHLTIDLIRRQFACCRATKLPGQNTARTYLSLESLFQPSARLPTSERQALALMRRTHRPLIKTHAILDQLPLAEETGSGKLAAGWVEWLRRRAHLLYVYRDGRSVLSSMHRWRQRSDPSARVSLAEFLRQYRHGLTPPERWARHVEAWLSQADAQALAFERVVAEPARVVAELAGWLSEPAAERRPLLPPLRRSIWHARLDRLSINPATTAMLGRYRGQAPERWQRALTTDDRRFFHDRAGSMLVRLGYETDDAWIAGENAPEVGA